MRLYVKRTRPLSRVPGKIKVFFLITLCLQCLWHALISGSQVERYDLPSPPSRPFIRLISLDDNIAAAKVIMLWLQAFDNQPGISIPLQELDYNRLVQWLDLMLALDNRITYPLFAAIRFYAEVPDRHKQRQMVRYIRERFIEKPDERWQYMAHAVYIARHRIKDKSLALACARLLRKYATGDHVPYWARHMELFVLEDMGEMEAAMVLIGGLLESGELTDAHQQEFLRQRLAEMERHRKRVQY